MLLQISHLLTDVLLGKIEDTIHSVKLFESHAAALYAGKTSPSLSLFPFESDVVIAPSRAMARGTLQSLQLSSAKVSKPVGCEGKCVELWFLI